VGWRGGLSEKKWKKAANSSGLQNGENSKIFPMETFEDHWIGAPKEAGALRPESRKTTMAANKPFWTLRVHEKRDVLVARHKARQMAHLLHFPPLEEACIAAGVFAIAAQAREHYEICDLCFQLDHHQLVVFARSLPGGDLATPSHPLAAAVGEHEGGSAGAASRTTSTRDEPAKNTAPLMKLAKPLPEAARGYAVDDLTFLIGRINDQAPADLFGELQKQNQEILFLLHLVNHPQTNEQLGQKSTSAA
jgi:hypothetical protein